MHPGFLSSSSSLRRKGDDTAADDGTTEEHLHDREIVTAAAGEFLEAALTSSRHGLIFRDASVGTSGTSRNHLLLSLLRSLERPWERSKEASLVANALETSPDQLRPYLATLEKVWVPRHSDNWMQVGTGPEALKGTLSLSNLQLSLDNICRSQTSFILSYRSKIW